MCELDYSGEMSFFQNQLTKAGISIEECDMSNYCGLTGSELQSIVNYEIAYKKRKEAEAKANETV